MKIFKNFKTVIISSAVVSVLCFVAGLIASYIYSMPTGACIVVTNLIVFILFAVIGKVVE